MPIPISIVEEILRGAARGTVNGFSDNPKAVETIMESAARGVFRVWREMTTPTATDASKPPETAELNAEVAKLPA